MSLSFQNIFSDLSTRRVAMARYCGSRVDQCGDSTRADAARPANRPALNPRFAIRILQLAAVLGVAAFTFAPAAVANGGREEIRAQLTPRRHALLAAEIG